MRLPTRLRVKSARAFWLSGFNATSTTRAPVCGSALGVALAACSVTVSACAAKGSDKARAAAQARCFIKGMAVSFGEDNSSILAEVPCADEFRAGRAYA